jgi:protease PrsW
MRIIVQRNGQTYGPYTAQVASQYLLSGSLMPQDLARDDSVANSSWMPLSKILFVSGVQLPSSDRGFMGKSLQDLRSFDRKLIFPLAEIKSFRWMRDRRLINLAFVGLAPAVALSLFGDSMAYWAIALYFSGLWSLFF